MKLLSIVTAVIMSVSSMLATTPVGYSNLTDYEIADEQAVTCRVAAENVLIEDIISYQDVFFNDENCAEIIVDLLESEGYTPIYSGTTEEWFYLSAIEGIDTTNAKLNDEIKLFLDEKGVEYTDTVSTESVLSEFDFTDSSGWIFTVNGEIPSVGMCDYIPANGDVIELHFTLYYGEDISS